MSKKKLFNLVELIAHILLFLAMAALPYVNVIIDKTFQWAIEEAVPLGKYTFFSYMKQLPYLFSTTFVILIAVNTVICAVSTFSKSEKKDGIIHTALSIILLIFGFLFYNAPYFATGYTPVILVPCQIISLALLAAIVVFSFLKRSNFAFPKSDTSVVVEKKSVPVSTTEELKKYKELLDSGVITQEEFDAKKKQLMGL